MKRIVILTQEFPFGKGEGFLLAEITWMVQAGIKVFIIPYKSHSTARALPDGIVVFNPSIPILKIAREYLRMTFDSWIWNEIIQYPHVLFRASNRQSFLFFLKMAALTFGKLNLFNRKIESIEQAVLYSYWFSGLTGGAIEFRKKIGCKVNVISRAHGGDLYEYRYASNYLPFRNYLIKNVDYVAVVSKNGLEYLRERYWVSDSKAGVHYLGIQNPGFICQQSSDNVIRVVSCSFISPVKRIPFLIDVLAFIAGKHPELKLDWNHLGGGEGLLEIEQYAHRHLTAQNIRWTLRGDLANHEVTSFYRENPVDMFVSVSSSEGIPVSMMEAMSVGIPVTSTDVGGVIELVGNDQVITLEASVADFANFMIEQFKKPQDRIAIRARWAEHFSANSTYTRFLEQINKVQ